MLSPSDKTRSLPEICPVLSQDGPCLHPEVLSVTDTHPKPRGCQKNHTPFPHQLRWGILEFIISEGGSASQNSEMNGRSRGGVRA